MRSILNKFISWLKRVFHIGNNQSGPGQAVVYYGCPNSKKAKKLQLSKKIYK